MNSTEIQVGCYTMGEIFQYNQQYHVPLYQRDYSWKHDDHVSEFWDDLKNHYEGESKKTYYFGTIQLVDKENTNEIFTIVDGQQRLTTSLIMLTAFRDYFLELGEEYDYITFFPHPD